MVASRDVGVERRRERHRQAPRHAQHGPARLRQRASCRAGPAGDAARLQRFVVPVRAPRVLGEASDEVAGRRGVEELGPRPREEDVRFDVPRGLVARRREPPHEIRLREPAPAAGERLPGAVDRSRLVNGVGRRVPRLFGQRLDRSARARGQGLEPAPRAARRARVCGADRHDDGLARRNHGCNHC